MAAKNSAVVPFSDPTQEPIDNMEMWDTLRVMEKTAGKDFSRQGGFKGTSIDPTWRMLRMTKVFGPVGIGWGYEQIDYRETTGMFFSLVKVWYVPMGVKPLFVSDLIERSPEAAGAVLTAMSGKDISIPLNARWTGAQWGGTEIQRKNRDNSMRNDDESFKMSITDAVGKCMLQVGLAADVYMGLFDGDKYAEKAQAQFAMQELKAKPENKPAALAEYEKEVCEGMAQNDTVESLLEYGNNIAERLAEIKLVDPPRHSRIYGEFKKLLGELKEKAKAAPKVDLTPAEDGEQNEPAAEPGAPTETTSLPAPEQATAPAKPAAPADDLDIVPLRPVVVSATKDEDGNTVKDEDGKIIPDWKLFSKRCGEIMAAATTVAELDKWSNETQAVVWKKLEEKGDEVLVGTTTAASDFLAGIRLNIRRRRAILDGTALTIKWASTGPNDPGLVRTVYADLADWLAQIEKFVEIQQAHNAAANRDYAEMLKAQYPNEARKIDAVFLRVDEALTPKAA